VNALLLTGYNQKVSMDTRTDDVPVQWKAQLCPFSIEYLPKVLDDIRLAVVDAFFSLPRGGAEIGGVLLGSRERGRVVITDFAPLACEHAFGPSFTLSKSDLARLEVMLGSGSKNSASTPVGWYHSHTRSEIFLTEADLEIHKRFFPEPWHVALVLKPHTFQPTRAGFFFREKDGSIQATGSYQEFVLHPLPMRPAPAAAAAAPAEPAKPFTIPEGPVVEIRQAAAQVVPEPEPEREPEPAPILVQVPALEPPPSEEPKRRRFWGPIGFLAVALGAGMALGVYQSRDRWLPQGAGSPPAAAPQASVTLTTLDHDGQLQISWDGNAPEILHSSGGALTIVDGGEPRTIALDPAHLQTGSFTYARQGEKVDLTLVINQSNGRKLVQAATYLGKAPQRRAAAPESPGAQKERDALAAENKRLKAEVSRQEERVRRLEKALEDVRIARQRELQRKRLENQAPDVGKQ
jgi:proteasome lid subunit RPN8/RPN11